MRAGQVRFHLIKAIKDAPHPRAPEYRCPCRPRALAPRRSCVPADTMMRPRASVNLMALVRRLLSTSAIFSRSAVRTAAAAAN